MNRTIQRVIRTASLIALFGGLATFSNPAAIAAGTVNGVVVESKIDRWEQATMCQVVGEFYAEKLRDTGLRMWVTFSLIRGGLNCADPGMAFGMGYVPEEAIQGNPQRLVVAFDPAMGSDFDLYTNNIAVSPIHLEFSPDGIMTSQEVIKYRDEFGFWTETLSKSSAAVTGDFLGLTGVYFFMPQIVRLEAVYQSLR